MQKKKWSKMTKNGPKCAELGIPLAVETYGGWGREGPGNIQPDQQEVGSGLSLQ